MLGVPFGCRDALMGGVLSLAKLGANGAGYYLDSVAAGAEEYYTGAGEAPGRWMGSGSAELGLAGPVVPEDLREVLAGVAPRSGRRLAAANRRVPGFDLTFSSPKSVSLLYALGGPDAARAVAAAHEAALTAALGYLEREACWVRRGHNGVEQVRGGGFVAAGFRHRTSRAGDPQLHTHVVVANLAKGEDGVWRTLDARHLYRQHRTAGFLYQAQLRAELSRSLGVRWQLVQCGMAELDGVPEHVVRVFSRRRGQILEHLQRRGDSGPRASEVAALDTRQAKTHLPLPQLRAEWAERAASAGMPARAWQHLVTAVRRQRRSLTKALTVTPQPPPMLAAALTESASTFARRDVLRAVAEAAQPGADVAQVELAADRLLADGEVVALDEDVFSTRTHLQIEEQVLAAAFARQHTGVAVVAEPVVDAAIAAGRQLSDEQEAMVRRLATSGHGVEVVIGHPGSGKTTALAAAARAWTDSGHRVIGAALAARAASELQTAAGIPSHTLASVLRDLEQHQLPPRTVVVLDEAGMVGTRDLHRLLTHTGHAKVVLVGDPKQLPEIQAGGAFAALARDLGAIELTENHRQHDRIERRALADLRAGRVDQALTRMAAHERVTHHPGVVAACQQMIDDWSHHRGNGEQVLLLASRRHHVAQLNDLAQSARLAAGELGDEHLTVGELTVHVGDIVMAQRNEYRYQLLNGQRAVITGCDPDGITVRTDKDVEATLPRRALESGLLQLGYASTVHKSQGATTDRALVLATDELAYEAGYTALTRGRHENHLYLTDPIDRDQARWLERSTAKELAWDRSTGLER